MRTIAIAAGLLTALVLAAPAAACEDHEPSTSVAVLHEGEQVFAQVGAAGQTYAGIPAALAAPVALTAAPAPPAHRPARLHTKLGWAGVYGGGLLLLGVMLVMFLPLGRRLR